MKKQENKKGERNVTKDIVDLPILFDFSGDDRAKKEIMFFLFS